MPTEDADTDLIAALLAEPETPLACHECAGDLPAGGDKACPKCGSYKRESKYQPEHDHSGMDKIHEADDSELSAAVIEARATGEAATTKKYKDVYRAARDAKPPGATPKPVRATTRRAFAKVIAEKDRANAKARAKYKAERDLS